jgi:hypothetical protein
MLGSSLLPPYIRKNFLAIGTGDVKRKDWKEISHFVLVNRKKSSANNTYNDNNVHFLVKEAELRYSVMQ